MSFRENHHLVTENGLACGMKAKVWTISSRDYKQYNNQVGLIVEIYKPPHVNVWHEEHVSLQVTVMMSDKKRIVLPEGCVFPCKLDR